MFSKTKSTVARNTQQDMTGLIKKYDALMQQRATALGLRFYQSVPNIHQVLLHASELNDKNDVELAIHNGADVNFCDKADKKTSLMKASEEGNIEIVKILIKHGANIDGEKNSMNLVKLLLRYDTNLNSLNNKNWSSLDTAVYHHRHVLPEKSHFR